MHPEKKVFSENLNINEFKLRSGFSEDGRLDELISLSHQQDEPRKPRSLVTRSGARVRGIHNSLYQTGPLEWETPEERTAIQVFDVSPATKLLASQPAILNVDLRNEKFQYTPDIVVERLGQMTIIECKPHAIIETNEWQEKLHAIGQLLHSHMVNFIVLPNEVQPNPIVKKNVDFLLMGGKAIHYALKKRKEDRKVIGAERPSTFCRTSSISRASSCSWRSVLALGVHQYERASACQFKTSLQF